MSLAHEEIEMKTLEALCPTIDPCSGREDRISMGEEPV